ncbi:MAG: hypothetical protein U0T74_04640 [Chitinophagales bacterium]
MATLKELHELVHSLDKNEKKYISMMMDSLAGKARDRYSRAFKTINEQKEFDAEKLKVKLSSGVNGMSLTEANNYVYDFICKNIVSYQPGNQLGYTSRLKLIEFFVNRKLFASAHKLLQQLIPELEVSPSIALLFRAHELQEMITINYVPVNKDYDFRVKFFEKRIAATNANRQNIDYLYLQFKFFHLVKTIGEPRNASEIKKYAALWDDPLMHVPISEINDRTIKIYYVLRGALMTVLHLPGASQEIRNQLKDFRERFSTHKMPLGEADLIDVLLSNMAENEKISWNELQQTKLRIAELEKQIPLISVHQRMRAKVVIIELTYYLKEGKYKEGIKLLENYMKPEEKNKWKDAPLAYMIPFTGARLFYLNNDPDKALDYLLLIQEQEKSMRPFFLISYRFLFLLCHYKLENFQFLDSAIISLTRSLKKMDKLYAPEKAMLQFLTHGSHINKMETHLRKLSVTLKNLRQDPCHKLFFEFGDYEEWLKEDSKKNR